MTTNDYTDPNPSRPYGYCGGDEVDKLAEKLIERDILAYQSCLVDELVKRSYKDPNPIVPLDDAENLYANRCPDCGEETEEADTDAEDWDGNDHRCTSCEWTGDYPDSEPQYIMEWWLVDRWLADKLSERGECILSDGQSTWWGRTCTGQGILLDGIMQRIVREEGWGGYGQ